MRISAINNLRICDESSTIDQVAGDLEVATSGDFCLVRKSDFLALCSFGMGKAVWCIDRQACEGSSDPTKDVFSTMLLWGNNVWIGATSGVAAELSYIEPESAKLVVRCLMSGEVLWEYEYQRPPLAPWAEKEPAWPGAPQEEIYLFLANSKDNLVLCVYRRTRCEAMTTPDFSVDDVPPFHCQTELYSFEPTTGRVLWRVVQEGLRLDLLDWKNFRGQWVNGEQAGLVDLDSGEVSSIVKDDVCFGRPAIYKGNGYFPWFHKKHKRVGYIRSNSKMIVDRDFEWSATNVRDTRVWPTCQGVALQINDQKLLWTTHDGHMLWEQRAKPYIYNMFASDVSDIFVGTDGAGGRLLGFDSTTGQETFNFRPPFCGFGDCYFFEEPLLAVASAAVKKSHSVPSQILLFYPDTKEMEFTSTCWKIVGAWARGVVFVSGEKGRPISFLDLETQ